MPTLAASDQLLTQKRTKNPYLFIYNAVLLVCWTAVLALTWREVLANGKANVYTVTESTLKIAQTAALLEVVHSAVGLVRSPVMITATQVASRIWILWGVVVAVPSVTQQSVHLFRVGEYDVEIGVVSLLTAWALSEIIRYGFFAAKELGSPPYFLLWLRYTGFIVLYPIGVSSELAMLWFALPTIKASKMWNLDMPNPLNFGFDYYIFCLLGAAMYMPGFPQLYFYMLKGRKRSLATAKAKAD